MIDQLYYGEYAAEYYDKLMSGSGKAGYLQTKDSYKHNAKLIFHQYRPKTEKRLMLLLNNHALDRVF